MASNAGWLLTVGVTGLGESDRLDEPSQDSRELAGPHIRLNLGLE